MSLVLTIARKPTEIDVAETRKLFNESGGTIGRAASSNWHLPDPSRFVSSQHASIRYAGGQYYLVDTSTNGVYVNDDQAPLGTGNEVPLKQGDRLYLGEYELHVEFEQSTAQDMGANEFDRWLDPQTDSLGLGTETNASVEDLLTPEHEILDPLAAMDKASGMGGGMGSDMGASAGSGMGSIDDDWLGSQSDNAAAPSQAFVAPNPVPDTGQSVPLSSSAGAIPDDWDIDDLLSGDEPDLPPPPPPPSYAAPPPAAPHPVMQKADPDLRDDIESLLAAGDDDLEYSTPGTDDEQQLERESAELDAFLGLDGSDDFAEDDLGFKEPAPAKAAPPPSPPPAPAKKIEEPSLDDLLGEGEPGDDSLLGFTTPEREPVPAPIPAPAPPPKAPPVAPPATPPPPAASAKPATPASAPEAAQRPNPAAAAGSAGAANIDRLILALGLKPEQVNAAQKEHFDTLVADMLRETMKGMMQVLGARNAIKNEFRMNVTMIQPVENNPLKFSPNVDEAMRNMFASQSNAYMPGVLAVKDGFEDIADHQVAVIAGMRAAFRSLLKRFEPEHLQVRFDKQQSKGSLLSGKKARYWESYTEFYQDLSNNMDEAFHELFGEDFAEAYEQQMSRLETARKK